MQGFLRSFGYALKGIKLSFAQRNFKIQLICALTVIALGFFFKITSLEWCLVLVCSALVLSLEVLNTSIEHLVDMVSPDLNPKAGKIKDLAAASVLISAMMSGVVALIIFWKYILALL